MTEDVLTNIRIRCQRLQKKLARGERLGKDELRHFLRWDAPALFTAIEQRDGLIHDLQLDSTNYARGEAADRRRTRQVVENVFTIWQNERDSDVLRNLLIAVRLALLARLGDPIEPPLPPDQVRQANETLRDRLCEIAMAQPHDDESEATFAGRLQRWALLALPYEDRNHSPEVAPEPTP